MKRIYVLKSGDDLKLERYLYMYIYATKMLSIGVYR